MNDNGLGFNFAIEIDKNLSDNNIEQYIKEANKMFNFEFGVGLNTKELTNVMNSLEQVNNDINIEAKVDTGSIDNTFKDMNSDVVSVIKNMDQFGNVTSRIINSISKDGDKFKEVFDSTGTLKSQQQIEQHLTKQQDANKVLLSLYKEKGKLEKQSYSMSGSALTKQKKQIDELNLAIAKQEKFIDEKDLYNAKEYSKVVEQIVKNEKANDIAQGKAEDKKYELMYTKLIKDEEEKQSRIIKERKEAYGELLSIEKQINTLTKSKMNATGENETLALTKQIEELKTTSLEKRDELIRRGLQTEEMDNVVQQTKIGYLQEQDVIEKRLLDKQMEQAKNSEEYIEAFQRKARIMKQDLENGINKDSVNTEELQNWIDQVNRMEAIDMKDANKQVADLTLSYREMTSDANSKRLRASVDDVYSLGQSFKSLAGYVTGAMVIREFWRSLRDGLKDVVSMNSAMTTLSITMEDLSKKQISGLVKSGQEMAKELKANVNDVMTTIKTVANANETIDTILNKSKPAVILSNLTGLGADKTVEMIQGAMQQFEDLSDGSEESALRVSDAMVSISKSLSMDFATGVQGMAESVEIMGSLSDQAGMSLERMLAMVSATSEKTRLSFSEVSNALKTVMSRTMRVANADLGIGEDEMLKTEKALNSVGIKIRDLDTGEMRPFMDTIDELASKWDGLNGTEQAYIADAMGKISAPLYRNIQMKIYSN